MAATNQIGQDYAVPPGWLLEDYLEEREWSQNAFAERCGRSTKLINQIIAGKASIDTDTAMEFEKVLGVSAQIWLNIESKYRLFLARGKEHQALDTDEVEEWCSQFPIKEIERLDLIPKTKDRVEQAQHLLVFFNVASISAWGAKVGGWAAKARHTKAVSSTTEATSVWLRLGEIETGEQECESYDKAKFQEALKEIRMLSRFSPEEFVPRMKHLCNSAGVAFVVMPPLKDVKLSGAAWWAKPDKAVIQLSLRGKSNDKFWFTFFHEAAHILLHSKKDVFIDTDDRDGDALECEADSWAGNFLVPKNELKEFVAKSSFSKENIEDFSAKLGVAPGIVLGRLQNDGDITWKTKLNTSLKQKFVFT